MSNKFLSSCVICLVIAREIFLIESHCSAITKVHNKFKNNNKHGNFYLFCLWPIGVFSIPSECLSAKTCCSCSLNFIRLLRVVITPSITTLLRGENDSKQSDEFQASCSWSSWSSDKFAKCSTCEIFFNSALFLLLVGSGRKRSMPIEKLGSSSLVSSIF